MRVCRIVVACVRQIVARNRHVDARERPSSTVLQNWKTSMMISGALNIGFIVFVGAVQF